MTKPNPAFVGLGEQECCICRNMAKCDMIFVVCKFLKKRIKVACTICEKCQRDPAKRKGIEAHAQGILDTLQEAVGVKHVKEV